MQNLLTFFFKSLLDKQGFTANHDLDAKKLLLTSMELGTNANNINANNANNKNANNGVNNMMQTTVQTI